MLGFLTRNDLITAQAEFDRRVSVLETASAHSVLRCEELHEMASRLIKRFETRQQRSKEKEDDWSEDDQPGGVDAVTQRVMARRGNGRWNVI